MKTLLHICCAPCSIHCITSLREEEIEPVGFWYNPNIHPFTEYKCRRNCLRDYAKEIGLKLVENDYYGLREFVQSVVADIDARCDFCYRSRLEKAAEYAAQNGFDCFTTTLLVSPYQNHEKLVAAGEAAAQKFGVSFLYRDFRPGFKDSQQIARDKELYMQKFCGCIFSEEDRYSKKRGHKARTYQLVDLNKNKRIFLLTFSTSLDIIVKHRS